MAAGLGVIGANGSRSHGPATPGWPDGHHLAAGRRTFFCQLSGHVVPCGTESQRPPERTHPRVSRHTFWRSRQQCVSHRNHQGDPVPEVLFSTDGGWSPKDVAEPDAAINLIPSAPRPPGPQRGPRIKVDRVGRVGGGGRGGRGGRGVTRRATRTGRVAGPGGWPRYFLGEPLQLLVKHRLGSVENAVTRIRQQNLALSFGILLVLGAGIIAVVFSKS